MCLQIHTETGFDVWGATAAAVLPGLWLVWLRLIPAGSRWPSLRSRCPCPGPPLWRCCFLTRLSKMWDNNEVMSNSVFANILLFFIFMFNCLVRCACCVVLAHLQDVDDRWHVLEFGFFVIGVHHKYCDSFHHLEGRCESLWERDDFHCEEMALVSLAYLADGATLLCPSVMLTRTSMESFFWAEGRHVNMANSCFMLPSEYLNIPHCTIADLYFFKDSSGAY